MASPTSTHSMSESRSRQALDLVQSFSESAQLIRATKTLSQPQMRICMQILQNLHLLLVPFKELVEHPVINDLAFYTSAAALQLHYPIIKQTCISAAFRGFTTLAYEDVNDNTTIPVFPQPSWIPDDKTITVNWLEPTLAPTTLYVVQHCALTLLQDRDPEITRKCHNIYRQVDGILKGMEYLTNCPGLANENFYEDVKVVKQYLNNDEITPILLKLRSFLNTSEDSMSRASSAPASPSTLSSMGSPTTPQDRLVQTVLSTPTKPKPAPLPRSETESDPLCPKKNDLPAEDEGCCCSIL